MFEIIFLLSAFLVLFHLATQLIILQFKIAYYEQKLKNRGVDISHIENITLSEVLNHK